MRCLHKSNHRARNIAVCVFLAVAAGAVLAAAQTGGGWSGVRIKTDAARRILVKKLSAKGPESSASTGLPPGSEIRTVRNTATEANHKIDGLAICMFHTVYPEARPPRRLNSDYIGQGALREELRYLKDERYYFPTWEEVRKYVDGDLMLPPKSVVLTFDDGAKGFLKYGLPVIEEMKVPVTSFLITGRHGPEIVKKYSNPCVSWQSHSHNMHRPGGHIGHGGIFTALPLRESMADLRKSIAICGSGEAFAYPFGDYNARCVEAVREAGFLCAVTTRYGRARPGDNPLLLPRVRMFNGQSLQSFIAAVR